MFFFSDQTQGGGEGLLFGAIFLVAGHFLAPFFLVAQGFSHK